MASSPQFEQITNDFSSCSIENNEATIANQLKRLDIHFNWNLHQSRPDSATAETIVSEFDRKLKEMFCCDSEFTFKSFCCQMTMVQELVKYDTDGALMKVLECEPWVLSLTTGTCRELAFISIREAIEYIYYGCKALALFKCGSTAEAKEVFLHIPDLENMEEKQKSGIYGIKACAFMEYGLQGFLKALEYISIARTMYPTMAEWHFLTGKLMSRIRHIKYPYMNTISDEEVNFYRTAYNLDKNEPSYALYMAQITREKSNGMFHECRYDREAFKNSLETMNKMNEEASTLYMMLIQSNQNDAYILGRCAFGMVKLPGPYKRLDLAEEAILQALKVSPENPLVNHYAGLIYHRFLNDNEKGLKYLERAANKNNYPALLDWLRLKHMVDPENYNPIPELTKALVYKDFAPTTLSTIGSWYLFNNDDVVRAWDHLKEITDDHHVLNHKSHFLSMRSKCNLLEVMYDEVKMIVAECKYKDEQEKEKIMSIRNQLQTLCLQSHPTDYNNLKSIILLESSSFISGKMDRSAKTGGDTQGNVEKWRSSTAKKKNLAQNSSSSFMRGRASDSWRRTDQQTSPGNQKASSSSSRDMRTSNSDMKRERINENWRSNMRNINSLAKNDSKVSMGATESWRNTNLKHQQTSPENQMASSNSSRPIRSINTDMKKTSRNYSTKQDSTQTSPSSMDNQKLKLSYNPKSNIHVRPLYFPKQNSNDRNFNNNL